MRAFLLSISLILAIDLAPGIGLFAQESKGKTEDKSEGKARAAPLSGKQIRKLVADLGHHDWETREAASQGLKGSGRKAMPILKQTYIETRDPEVKIRIKSLAPSYFESAIYGGYPFIGITLFESVEPSVELGGGRAGIVVYNVLPGMPAEAAGMQKKDVIVSFAKHKVTPAHRSRHHLASWVRECKVGQEVDVGILREKKPM
ncbi:MAG: PDZ domain-containing protein [Planctomycetota bacterium]|nr:PDZ domain-containing protein [Planctomycetota bacterium]